MIRRTLSAAVIAICALAISPSAAAKKAETGFTQIRKEAPVTIKADKAYLLMRAPKLKSSVFVLRVPTEQELADYQTAKRAEYDRKKRDEPFEAFVFEWEGASNLYELRPTKHYSRPVKDMRVVLAEAPPGDYIVYGIGYNGILSQCHCMGTVGFTAKAGQVTDLGTSLITPAWEPSPYPELTQEADLGRVARIDFGLFAATIRPANADDTKPALLATLPSQPAQYRAIGPWVDTRRIFANRLGAVPGVLEYREGIAFDPKGEKTLRLAETQ
ncbi:MAG: hypothetical protein ABJP34_01745 [Erythrobacter sp.]